jgi:hypothetical protein
MRFRYRADHQLRNAVTPRECLECLATLDSFSWVEPLAFSVRDPAAVDNVIGLS